MKTNTALTLYNKYYDSESGLNVYPRTVIPAVMWQNRKARNVLASGGNLAVDQATIFIPFTGNLDNFTAAKAWLALSDKSANWTLQRGDLVVKGEVNDELGSEFTPSDLKAKYDDVLEISMIDTMDMGSKKLQHWQVGAK